MQTKEERKAYKKQYDEKNKKRDKKYRIAHRAEKKKYNEDHKEHLTECQKINRTNNIDKYRAMEKGYQIKKNYGISIEQFNNMLITQNNECAICHNEFKPFKDTHIDHNHITGKVRGLLCSKCNMSLGGFNDEINNLESAIIYLKNND